MCNRRTFVDAIIPLTLLMIDSTAAMAMVAQEQLTSKSKHVEVKLHHMKHFSKEWSDKDNLCTHWKPSRRSFDQGCYLSRHGKASSTFASRLQEQLDHNPTTSVNS